MAPHVSDTCHFDCPHYDVSFREGLATRLTSIDTKLTMLVGKDGTNGEWSSVKGRIGILETFMNQTKGAGKYSGKIWSAAVAFVAALIGSAVLVVFKKG